MRCKILMLGLLTVGLLAMGPMQAASAAEAATDEVKLLRIEAVQVHLIGGTATTIGVPALTIVADGELLDPDELDRLALLEQLDVIGMLEQLRADTLAGMGAVEMPPDLLGQFNALMGDTGVSLDAGATGLDALDALIGLLGRTGGSGHPLAGVMDGGLSTGAIILLAIVAVVVIGGAAALISTLVDRIPSNSDGADAGGGVGGGTGDPTPVGGGADGGVPDHGTGDAGDTPESLRDEAASDEASAALYDKQAEAAEAEGDKDAADEARRNAATKRADAAEKRKEADDLEQKNKEEGNDIVDPDMGGGDPFTWRAYLLSLNPALEGTEFDRMGQALSYLAALAAGERPLHSYPVPTDDGSGDRAEVNITTFGCIGPACGLVDPAESSGPVTITSSMLKKLLTFAGPGGPAVSYPPLDGETPDTSEPVTPPRGPGGPGCAAC